MRQPACWKKWCRTEPDGPLVADAEGKLWEYISEEYLENPGDVGCNAGESVNCVADPIRFSPTPLFIQADDPVSTMWRSIRQSMSLHVDLYQLNTRFENQKGHDIIMEDEVDEKPKDEELVKALGQEAIQESIKQKRQLQKEAREKKKQEKQD